MYCRLRLREEEVVVDVDVDGGGAPPADDGREVEEGRLCAALDIAGLEGGREG